MALLTEDSNSAMSFSNWGLSKFRSSMYGRLVPKTGCGRCGRAFRSTGALTSIVNHLRIGMEPSGHARWLERLLAELPLTLGL